MHFFCGYLCFTNIRAMSHEFIEFESAYRLYQCSHTVNKIVACIKNVDGMKGGMTTSIYTIFIFYLLFIGIKI